MVPQHTGLFEKLINLCVEVQLHENLEIGTIEKVNQFPGTDSKKTQQMWQPWCVRVRADRERERRASQPVTASYGGEDLS